MTIRIRASHVCRSFFAAVALLTGACEQPDEASVSIASEEADDASAPSLADEAAGDVVAYTDPWYFCVDHPCPNLKVMNHGGCPYSAGLLLVGVENVGNATAGATKTYVEFVGHGTRLLNTPGLTTSGSGKQSVVWIGAPSSWVLACKTSICKWKVHADHSDVVSEIDGTNNYLSGSCWLP